MQSQQLLTESQVFKDEVLAGAESADHPPEEMPERHVHARILSENFESCLAPSHLFCGCTRFWRSTGRDVRCYADIDGFFGSSCGPLVSARQKGFEHRFPTREAMTRLVASEKSSPITVHDNAPIRNSWTAIGKETAKEGSVGMLGHVLYA